MAAFPPAENKKGWKTNSLTGRPMPDPKSLTFVNDFNQSYFAALNPETITYVAEGAYAVSNRHEPRQLHNQDHLQQLARPRVTFADLDGSAGEREHKFVLHQNAATPRISNAANQDPAQLEPNEAATTPAVAENAPADSSPSTSEIVQSLLGLAQDSPFEVKHVRFEEPPRPWQMRSPEPSPLDPAKRSSARLQAGRTLTKKGEEMEETMQVKKRLRTKKETKIAPKKSILKVKEEMIEASEINDEAPEAEDDMMEGRKPKRRRSRALELKRKHRGESNAAAKNKKQRRDSLMASD